MSTERTMNWITNLVRPKIRSLLKRETPENLWIKCPDTGQMVFQKEVEDNLWVIPGSEHHLRMTARRVSPICSMAASMRPSRCRMCRSIR